jgi:hypothetical protein
MDKIDLELIQQMSKQFNLFLTEFEESDHKLFDFNGYVQLQSPATTLRGSGRSTSSTSSPASTPCLMAIPAILLRSMRRMSAATIPACKDWSKPSNWRSRSRLGTSTPISACSTTGKKNGRGNLSKASDKTYKQFLSDPDDAPGYLRGHYNDGRLGLMKPPKSQKLAMAAWRAGRDSVAVEVEVAA